MPMASTVAVDAAPKLLVASIDFGTTFSGWAFLFKHQYDTDPSKVSAKNWNNGTNISSKTPTTILIQPDGKTVEAFGYLAEDKYATLAAENKHRPYFYFRRFKMMLFEKMNLKRDLVLEDATRKQLPAMTVFSLAIRCLKEDLLSECGKQIGGEPLNEKDVHWVVTVPAIWKEAAKQFMREAAGNAGIHMKRLTIALEPEAASLFCKHISVLQTSNTSGMSLDTFSEGTKYIVLDAGGGTVDITVHQVLRDGGLKELHRADGGAWGGTKVDEKFEQFLIKIFGAPIMSKFKQDNMDDYIDIFRNFEIKKRNVSLNHSDIYQIRLPVSLVETFQEETNESIKDTLQQMTFKGNVSLLKGNKLQLDALVMRDFFADAIHKTVDHLAKLVKEREVRGSKFILMVGGFSESPILQETVKERFSTMNIIIPPEASLVVLKGAAVFGHRDDVIEERISRYTYGFIRREHFIEGFHPEELAVFDDNGDKRCRNAFQKIVEIDEPISVNEPKECPDSTVPATEEQTTIVFPMYASTSKHPKTEFDDGNIFIGSCKVMISDMTVPRNDRKFRISGVFGQTEIRFKALEVRSKQTTTAIFDLL